MLQWSMQPSSDKPCWSDVVLGSPSVARVKGLEWRFSVAPTTLIKCTYVVVTLRKPYLTEENKDNT